MESSPKLFSKIFHYNSAIENADRSPVFEVPEEWKTIYYKEYPRLKKISLESRRTSNDNIFDLIKNRKTQRDFRSAPLTKEEISTLLEYSAGKTTNLSGGRLRRAYPSAGARYPIELYPMVLRGNEEVSAGLYHYAVRQNELETLWGRSFSEEEMKGFFLQPELSSASMIIIMTAVFWRNQNKYGDRGYRLLTLEAGFIGQNIYLISQALGLKCAALSGIAERSIEKILDIDGVTESIIYGVAVGK